jgi:hypothetical protein
MYWFPDTAPTKEMAETEAPAQDDPIEAFRSLSAVKRQELFSALLRLLLGFGQMTGAVATAILLLETGLSIPTVAVLSVTTVLAILSRRFHPRR